MATGGLDLSDWLAVPPDLAPDYAFKWEGGYRPLHESKK